MIVREGLTDRVAGLIALGWLCLYGWRAMAGYFSLSTNAFDLSVFDYALSSLAHGGTGKVPFMGQSIFSQHCMPILVLLVPVYSLWQSPAFLLCLQVFATAAAGWLFFQVQRQFGIERVVALGMMTVFLFSRRTHSATAGSFYPECFQALLTFAVVLTWRNGGWRYWTPAVLLLTTKEDAAIYLSAFALVTSLTPLRQTRRALATVSVSVVWLAVAMFIVIPGSRSADGLPTANPLIESRFGSPSGHVEPSALAGRFFTSGTAGRVVDLVAVAGGLPLLGPIWLFPAVPGILINLVAEPESMQAALTGHYAWPVLPWVFMAAAAGVSWVSLRWRRLAFAWLLLLVLITLADNPALQRIHRTRWDAEARTVRAQLQTVSGRVILAQANLIPHLPHQTKMFAVRGGDARPSEAPDLVLLTEVGDLWPMTREEVVAEIRRYDADPAYERVSTGPLYAFALKKK